LLFREFTPPADRLLPLNPGAHYTLDTWTRLWVEEFFPANVNRVLYLDGGIFQHAPGHSSTEIASERLEPNLSINLDSQSSNGPFKQEIMLEPTGTIKVAHSAREPEAEGHVDGDRSPRRERASEPDEERRRIGAGRGEGRAGRCDRPGVEMGALGRLERPVRPEPEDQPPCREVGREGHVHRPRHISGWRDAHLEPIAGTCRIGRRIRRRRAVRRA
jgi:hypothetical protein